MLKNRIPLFIVVVLLALTNLACVKEGCTDPEALNYNKSAERDDESCRYGDKNVDLKADILINHANIAFALYSDAHTKAVALKTASASFLDNPTKDGLDALRQAWRTAHFYYLKDEALRFSSGPIDDEKDIDRQLDAWPIQPALIDAVNGSYVGIVHDSTLIKTISSASIAQFNESKGEGQISTGFYVVEFLLWGKDSLNNSISNSGSRLFTDFSLTDPNVVNAKRRRQYLSAAIDLIVTQLAILSSEWDIEGGSNYRSGFLNMDVDKALKLVLTGLGTLSGSEMADRALLLPVYSNDQSKEISTFSDNTYNDLIAMSNSLTIVYTGFYESENTLAIEGSSLHDLAVILNNDLDLELTKELDASSELITEIPQPFDWQISKESQLTEGPIQSAASSLSDLERLIIELAREIGFGLQTELP